MDRAKAIELITSHLRQCAMLMPIEWVEKNGSGELMEAFEMAFDALRKQAEYEDMEEQGRLVVLEKKEHQADVLQYYRNYRDRLERYEQALKGGAET